MELIVYILLPALPMNPLSKIFSVLEEVIKRQERGASYSDILAALGLPKSTVHRVLKDLCTVGYITFVPETKRYFGSMKIARLGAEVILHFQLREQVRPFLEALHKETGLTSNLAILDGGTGVFVDKIEPKDFGVKLISELGKTFPLHCTGLGKVFLAFSSGNLVNEVLSQPLPAITDKTITDATTLHHELATVRLQGYAIDNEEITRGIVCIAAPVFRFDASVAAAVSVALPAYRERQNLDKEIATVTKYSRLMSQALGYLGH